VKDGESTMPHQLRGIRLKLDRAHRHLAQVTEVLRPLDEGDVTLVRESHEQRPDFFWLRLLLPSPDPELSTIIGDCLYNLRSPLDHLVYQLVTINGAPGTTSHQFPICDTPSGFQRQLDRGRLDGVAAGPAVLIEGFQPYQLNAANPRNHPLWILNELMNTDKHRALNTTTVLARDLLAVFGEHTASSPNTARHGGFGVTGGRYRNGEVVMGGVLEAVGGLAPITARAALRVEFEEPAAADQPVLSVLQSILDFIEQTIIPAFEPVLTNP
jgi:hypothetical protein